MARSRVNTGPERPARGWVGSICALFALPVDDPEHACAQRAALGRQIPLLYAILCLNALALVWTFIDRAPRLLTIALPAMLLLACTLRLIVWLRNNRRPASGAEAIRQMRVTMLMVPLMGVAFTFWALSLFPYGDAAAQCEVAFYIAATEISGIFCLRHLRGAALLLTCIVLPPFTLFFLTTGRLVLVAMAVNMLLVRAGVLHVMLRNYSDFTALILSQRELIARQREMQRLSDENLRLANLDSLSGLPNRRRFFAELEAVLGGALREGRRCAVVLIDLDRFKGVNDVYGHAAGDRLLMQLAVRLKRLAGKHVFIARLGGDEFGAIIDDCEADSVIDQFGAAVRAQFQSPCVVGDRLASISCSIGVATYPEAGASAEELFERADYALYYGKLNRRGELVVFSDWHETAIRQAGRVEQVFRAAALESELWIAFQPIVDVLNNRVIAFEALARWHSAELGPIGPDVFIPIAERSQMIGRVTEILLAQALAAARHWPASIGLSFNLSAQDLITVDTMGAVRRIVAESGVAPSRIAFEVTETALLADFDQAVRAVDSLHALGASIALDDFGTGYSSLGYVQRLPLDKIKIDRRFVADADVNRTSANIVKIIVDLCRNLDLVCVVEGVETESQLRAIVSLGCRFVQGYVLSRPVAADAVLGLIEQIATAKSRQVFAG